MSDYIRKSELLNKFNPNGEPIDPILVRSKIVHCPTLDEKEIISKPFERVVERLEEKSQKWADVYNLDFDKGHINEYAEFLREGIDKAIEIVKEECGINE